VREVASARPDRGCEGIETVEEHYHRAIRTMQDGTYTGLSEGIRAKLARHLQACLEEMERP